MGVHGLGLEGGRDDLLEDGGEKSVDGGVVDDQLGNEGVVRLEVIQGLVRTLGVDLLTVSEGTIEIGREPLPLARSAESRVKVDEVVGSGHPVVVEASKEVLESHVAQEAVEVQTGVPVVDRVSRGGVEILEVLHQGNQLREGFSDGVVAKVLHGVGLLSVGSSEGAFVKQIGLLVECGGVGLDQRTGDDKVIATVDGLLEERFLDIIDHEVKTVRLVVDEQTDIGSLLGRDTDSVQGIDVHLLTQVSGLGGHGAKLDVGAGEEGLVEIGIELDLVRLLGKLLGGLSRSLQGNIVLSVDRLCVDKAERNAGLSLGAGVEVQGINGGLVTSQMQSHNLGLLESL